MRKSWMSATKTMNIIISIYIGMIILTFLIPLKLSIQLYSIGMITVIVALIIKIMNLQYQLNMDKLTFVPDWNNFIRNSKRSIRKNPEQQYAIVTFDILHFRTINNVFGHKKGDEILLAIAKEVERMIHNTETVTRYSLDQFNIMIQYKDEAQLLDRVKSMDKSLSAAFLQRKLQIYYGIYLIPEGFDDIEAACDYATTARLSIKGKYETNIAIFDSKLKDEAIRVQEVENKMEKALANEEFVVYYQPKYGLNAHNIVGAEALIRWKTKENTLIPPKDFIPIFEQNGFIIQLDYFVIEQVCKKLKEWISRGIDPFCISVNLSRVHLHTPNIVEIVKSIVDRYEIEYKLIEIELTESAFFQDKEILINTIRKFHNVGFGVSMDDFGSGYSSLNLLKDLSLDIVKLDGELFRSAEDDKKSNIIIKNTIEMVKRLDMKIVAEGVETKEQVDFLHANGCDFVQGYYFARPMNSMEFDNIVFRGRNKNTVSGD